MSAEQLRYPCSGAPTDSKNSRKRVSNFLQPDWQIKNCFFNKPIMVQHSNPGTPVGAQNNDPEFRTMF